jgi:hypothetical protein
MNNYTDKIHAENDGDTRGDAARAPGGAPVGYCNPPRQHQFKKGYSGNKPGRKKGSRNMLSIFKDVAEEKIKVKIGDDVRKITPSSSSCGPIITRRERRTRMP